MDFPGIKQLPPYVFNVVGELKGSLDFSTLLLQEAKVAVSPGVRFGAYGNRWVRFALIENEHRTRQAVRGIRKALAADPRAGRQAFAAAR